ncbi:MAG TPA: mechanosensitive ion channel domain-containing protein [Gaiellaceae bacterium]|jgi:small-conductance mechanosensitive channel
MSSRVIARGAIALGAVCVAGLVVLAVVGRDERLALVAGLVGVALAVAFREVFESLAAGAGAPYAAGDRVRIGGVEGDVVGVGLLRTKVRDDAGDVVSIANRVTLASPVHACTNGVRDEVRVGVPYRADWERAERILLEVAGEGSKVDVVLTDNWIELVLWCTSVTRDEVSRAILRRFGDAGIPVASRTVEVKVGDPLDAARPSNVP